MKCSALGYNFSDRSNMEKGGHRHAIDHMIVRAYSRINNIAVEPWTRQYFSGMHMHALCWVKCRQKQYVSSTRPAYRSYENNCVYTELSIIPARKTGGHVPLMPYAECAYVINPFDSHVAEVAYSYYLSTCNTKHMHCQSGCFAHKEVYW